jgi:hypothetical protein
MEQEPNYIRDLVEEVTKLPRQRKELPVCHIRNVVISNPLMYYHEEERQVKIGESL